MMRMLQLTLLAVAMGLLLGRSEPVKAQRYYSQNTGFSADDVYRPRYRSNRRKIRKSRSNLRRISPRAARARARARSARIRRARARLKKRRNRKIARRKPAILKKRKLASLNKRKVASIPRARTRKNTSAPVKNLKGPVQIVVSLAKQRVSIYKGGKAIASARVSTGRSGHRTPPGVFSIIQKRKSHFSNLYNSAPMPFMQRITWSGLALHAGNVSRPYQSHGCIRMPYGFAKKLFKSTRMGAHVIVASGSSSLQPISHMSLVQPVSDGSLLASNGVQTAALSDRSDGEKRPPLLEQGGIPGFVRPVVAANRHLEQMQQDLQIAIAAAPQYELTLEQAKKRYAERKELLSEAKKRSVKAQKIVRKPRFAVRKIKRRRAQHLRAHKKAQWRANWAREIIEKRNENPKYEGKWMKMAIARSQSRDAKALKVKANLDEITEQLDTATVVYDQVADEARKARDLVVLRNNDLQEAGRLLKIARQEFISSQRSVIAFEKKVKAAIAGVKKAKAREKLPLRIFITPRTGIKRIKTAQRLLTEIGYTPGPADGKVGKNTRTAINAFQTESNVRVTGKVSDELIDELHNRVGRVQTSRAHIYVRQGFRDLFDAPIDMVDPSKPLGTHLYTAMHFENGAGAAQWTAVTVKNTPRKVRKKLRGKKAREVLSTPRVTVSAKQALDRINLPATVRRQLSMLLTPGSSMVVSDKGLSNETGKGTDFVVLTR